MTNKLEKAKQMWSGLCNNGKMGLYQFLKSDVLQQSIVNLYDWREEFYFLTNCKHKIILNSANSYSEGFWASVLNEKSYNLNVIESEIKTRKIRPNWIRE
jgi:hypothetical protein